MSRRWSLAAVAAVSPLLAALSVSIWKTPYPISETIAVLEDIQRAGQSYFDPTARSWYRPLYFLTWDWFWKGSGSLDTALALFKGLEVLAPLALVALLIWHLAPRTRIDAAAAVCAATVLIGSPGFRANLEIPLLMTLFAMPLIMLVWMLLASQPRAWHTPAVVALLTIAIGFKEQGLVIAPVVVIAWWTRAPGATARLTASIVVCTVTYLIFRLWYSANWPIFEQAMGLGFRIIEPDEALARFGAFPYWMYLYNALSTTANVLIGEPSGGLFGISLDVTMGRLQPWEVVYLIGAIGMTGIIVWWSWTVVPGLGRTGWTDEGRVSAAFITALAASAALSYHYSRDRLGGMAAVFYALAAYHALRFAIASATTHATATRVRPLALALATIAVCWQIRAVGTLEWTRRVSEVNLIGWRTQLASRRMEFADRHVYLDILNHMVPQGLSPDAVRPTNYPSFVQRTLAAPVPQQ